MKRRLSRLVGCTVRAEDGNIGTVREFYFDDHGWTIRYVVVDTGRWLSGRLVLISTAALKKPDWKSRLFPVDLTKQQVQNSPGIDTDKSVSRQHEAELHAYYGWPVYWGLEPYVGVGYPVPTHLPSTAREQNALAESAAGDPHLRSTGEVTGYHIRASDGEIGHVQDFIVEDETWAIRYVVVNTQNWLPGKSVLVFPAWIKRVSWDKSEVFVDLSRESIKNSPAFEPSKRVDRSYEERLFEHYGRPGYWDNERQGQPNAPLGSAAENEVLRIPALIVDLGDRSATVRERARRALVAMGKAALKPLMEALTNSTEYGRGQAAKALGEIGDQAAAPALVKALEDEKFDVRWLAARALVALGRDGLPPLLQALIERPHSTWLRQGVHHVLHDEQYQIWHEQLAPIMKALEGDDPVDALPGAVETVLRALAHPSSGTKK
ncbi:MAG TPA: HEAT repeat domain-containing protein [Verrucomicrobiae bacterium]|nr:HEAT repeat domain-containing protein [Verrucomicrobiae bacterium]